MQVHVTDHLALYGKQRGLLLITWYSVMSGA